MLKGESGYGFHLHGEKGKSGQFIRKVEPGSPAEAAGLRAGDRVVEVNGLNVEQETHHQVVQRIKAVETETRLLVVDKETDEYLCSLRLTCTEDMVHNGILLSSGVSPSKPLGSDNGEVWKPQLDVSGASLQRHSHSFSSHGSRKRLAQLINDVEAPRESELVTFVVPAPGVRNGNGPGHCRDLHKGLWHPGLGSEAVALQVNGINVEGLRHSEVVSHIKSRENEARLLVVDPETDEYFKKLGVTPTEEHTKGVVPQPMTNGSAQTQLNGGSTSSSHSDLQSPGKESEDGDGDKKDPFEESGLSLSPTAAEAKEKVRAKRVKKRAPQMDWNKKREIFSNF
ncbi:Na(+)/H(+) exchange regulatory cofactor NHE-RF2 [Pitangus sulphuratus]|nr:Na(+)/H(+) exchange regulatory cofactor NHE-RF2 [Pitangus sulphuratus]